EVRSGVSDSSVENHYSEQLARHLVGIICRHSPTLQSDAMPEGVISASAFVLEAGGTWFLATAGHYFEAVNEFRSSHPSRNFSFWMADSFGTKKRSDYFLPLHFDESSKSYVHNDQTGFDFGVLKLDPNTVALLENGERVPVHESHWKNWNDL